MYDTLVFLVLPLQNIVGLVLNLIVLILICNLAEGALQHVKTCLVLSTVHSILYCGMNHLLVPTHHVTREGYFLTLHGEFLTVFHPDLIDFLLLAWSFLHSLTWTLQPLHFIVQYLVIAKKGGVNARIFVSLLLLSLCLSIPYVLLCVFLFPSETEAKLISHILQRSYSSDDLPFVSSPFVYGNPFENGKWCDRVIFWLGIGCSFGLSYSIVLFYVRKLVRITRNDLLKDRKESIRAHTRVVRWLITQSLVPFTPLFAMTSIAVVSVSLNLHLASFSILISLLSTASPIVQGLVNVVQITRWNCSNLDISHYNSSSRRNTITQSITSDYWSKHRKENSIEQNHQISANCVILQWSFTFLIGCLIHPREVLKPLSVTRMSYEIQYERFSLFTRLI